MSNKKYAIGIDVGGTKMSAALFEAADLLPGAKGKVIADSKLATPQDSLNHFIIMIDALIRPLEDEARKLGASVAGIGVGIPGVFSREGEKILKCRNVPILDGVRLPEKLEKKFGVPVKMDNDTNCFVRAEAVMGAGMKFNNIFGVIIGTGIGGAWCVNRNTLISAPKILAGEQDVQGAGVNKEIYQGAHQGAGEPGRMIIDFNNPLDIEQAYHKLMQDNPERMSQEAIRGDILAEKAFKEFGRYLGLALANIVNLLDPEAIILGGGAMESSDLFLAEAKAAMKEFIFSPEAKKVKILKGKLGDLAGAIGAALLATHNT